MTPAKIDELYHLFATTSPAKLRQQAIQEQDPERRRFLFELYEVALGVAQQKIISRPKFVM